MVKQLSDIEEKINKLSDNYNILLQPKHKCEKCGKLSNKGKLDTQYYKDDKQEFSVDVFICDECLK